VDTLTAAQLLIHDRQVDKWVGSRAWLVAILAATSLGHAAQAAPWPACNDPTLFPPMAEIQEPQAYPESARQAGAEGFVDLSFVVLKDGRVGWTRIQRAEPSGFFEAAALAAVRDWRYRPALAGGIPAECAIRTRLRFTLTESVAARLPGATRQGQTASQPPPLYPDQARIDGLEGYVEVSVEVAPDGRVIRAEVRTAMPRGEFEQAALAAVRTWRFPAGQGEVQTLSRRFDFSLPDSYPHDPAPTLLAAALLPPEACERDISGQVKLEVTTDADGRVTSARILEATPPGLFDETALAVARNSRMAPAYRGGVSIAARALLTLRFEPDEAYCGAGRRGDDARMPTRSAPQPRVSASGKSPSPALRQDALQRLDRRVHVHAGVDHQGHQYADVGHGQHGRQVTAEHDDAVALGHANGQEHDGDAGQGVGEGNQR
jgi:protein TonB